MKKFYRIILLLIVLIFISTYNPKEFDLIPKKNIRNPIWSEILDEHLNPKSDPIRYSQKYGNPRSDPIRKFWVTSKSEIRSDPRIWINLKIDIRSNPKIFKILKLCISIYLQWRNFETINVCCLFIPDIKLKLVVFSFKIIHVHKYRISVIARK